MIGKLRRSVEGKKATWKGLNKLGGGTVGGGGGGNGKKAEGKKLEVFWMVAPEKAKAVNNWKERSSSPVSGPNRKEEKGGIR